MRTLTGDAAADRYLTRLAEVVGVILGPELVGVYVANSGARGDYLPGRSDLDVAVVVSDGVAPETISRFADAVRHRSLACPASRLELVVYRRSVAAHPGPRPSFVLNLNTGPCIGDHVGLDPAAEPFHWFVLDLAAAADRAVPVVGPSPARIFGSPPAVAVREALSASAAWHAQHDAASPNRVLNACRAWRWSATGGWSTKSEAAAWAIARGADPALVRHALELRSGERTDPLDPAEIRQFASRVEREISRGR
jgi:aminoglycoside adenylyltransferase-like protein